MSIPGIEGVYVYATGAKRSADTQSDCFWPRFAVAALRRYHNGYHNGVTLATVEDVLVAKDIASQLAYLYNVPCEITPSAQRVIDDERV